MAQPVASAAFRADGAHRWGQDVDVIRTLGLAQVGAERVVSSAVSAAFTLLPIGGRLFRAQLPNLVVLSLAGALLYLLALRIRCAAEPMLRHGALAAAAALTATNSAVWQLQTSQVGGATFAALLVVLLAWQLRHRPVQPWLAQGVLLGLLAVESRAAFFAGIALIVAHSALHSRLPRLGALLLGSSVLATTSAICLLPSLIGVTGSGPGRLGLSLALPIGAPASPISAFADAGFYFGGLSVLGLLFAALRKRWRSQVVPWATALVLYWLMPGPALGCVVLGAIGLLASVGLQAIMEAASISRLPLREQTFRLGALIHLGALLMLVEHARDAHTNRAVSGTSEWSEQAFARLPPRSLLITHTPEAAWRLWAQRISSGTRPDVLLVPQALLSHGDLARDLLSLEPALGRMVRDVALEGKVSEFALSTLADVRPVRTELDPAWDRRLLAHCVSDGLWFRFLPHEMGRSDRAQGLKSSLRALKTVQKAATRGDARDAHTWERLRGDAEEHLVVVTALRDRASAKGLLRRLERLQLEPRNSARFREAIDNPRGLASVQDLLR